MQTSTLSLLRIHFTTCTVPWGKDTRHILLSWLQHYKATARTARAKREHHGPVRAPSFLLEAVFMQTSTLSLLRIHFTTCTEPWGKDTHHILLYLMAAVLQGHAQHAPYAHNASTMGRLGLPSCLLEAVFMQAGGYASCPGLDCKYYTYNIYI